MSEAIQTHLALILFLPWFAILGALFWFVPRQPRDATRRLFDSASLLVAIIAFVVTIRWTYGYAVPTGSAGNIWKQVLATASGYGVFLAVMLLAWLVRRGWLRRRGG